VQTEKPIELGVVQVVNRFRYLFHIAAGFNRGLSESIKGSKPDPYTIGDHLIREVKELQIATSVPALTDQDQALEELADCLILLSAMTDALGFSPEAIVEKGLHKMAQNCVRQWQKPDAAGVIEHVRE
jgi:NTP pyrophosphatase (non-canonical NTP hydrolase)